MTPSIRDLVFKSVRDQDQVPGLVSRQLDTDLRWAFVLQLRSNRCCASVREETREAVRRGQS